ncbi:MAG TPA: transglutaminaseTgpA domain-containing protein, partial [Acidimicrobiia bacterium]|nr:transglutaminaseTgpA domain-containing protein [Acidimicrobiia bacterium]
MRPARPGAPLALAAVSAVAAAGCCRLFGDAGWVVPVFAAVAGAHSIGALTRRWSGRAAIAAHGAALTLLLAESVAGHSAYGVPTPATVTALGRAVGRAPDALRAAIVPAPSIPELLVWVAAGLWIAAAVADGLAQRRRAGLLAVLPLTVFPVVVAALGTDRLRATLTFALAVATALYAALDRAAALPTASARLLRPARPLRPAGIPAGWASVLRRDRRILGVAGPALAVGLAAVVLGPVVPGVGRAVV